MTRFIALTALAASTFIAPMAIADQQGTDGCRFFLDAAYEDCSYIDGVDF